MSVTLASPSLSLRAAGGLSLGARIILINALAMLLMVGGQLYFGRYLEQLVSHEIDLQTRQAQLTANKLVSDALTRSSRIDPARARAILRDLIRDTDISALVIDPQGRTLAGDYQPPRSQPLAPVTGTWLDGLLAAVDWLAMLTPAGMDLPVYDESLLTHPARLTDVTTALSGQARSTLWNDRDKGFVVTVAVPIRRDAQVVGAILLTRGGGDISATLQSLRRQLLQIFGLMLGISMVLSLYMAQTIARPLKRLARAARQAQSITGGMPEIPDYQNRNDEIGELSGALQAMTRALWERLGAIEMFAADVAHELKNPLTSMRSALETLNRIQDEAQRQRLLAIIHEDVIRMQRLITDIAAASRLEAELSRTPPEPVDIGALLTNLITSRSNAGCAIRFHISSTGLIVKGIPGQLVQVIDNLIANAQSFSPPGDAVTVRVAPEGKQLVIKVEDNGPGIPPGKQEKIFERFYSERPAGENFGTHSGLGLAICRQIIEAHGGKIYAENRQTEQNTVCGARFVVLLPLKTG